MLIFSSFLIYSMLALKPDYPGKYQNDLLNERLKGKVKLCTEYFYEKPDNKELDKTSAWNYKSRISYNKEGNTTTIDSYNDYTTNNVVNTMMYTYDIEGRKVMTQNNKGHIISSSVYSYNLNHRLIEDISSGTHVNFHIIYNNYGLRDTMYVYNIVGKLNSKVIYHYDKANNKIEEDRYKPDGSLSNKEACKYDKHRNKIEEIKFDAKGIRTGKTTHQYDVEDNEIMKTDSNIIYIGGTGGRGNNQENNTYAHIYKYYGFDKAGNWLQQNEVIDNHIIRIIKREIEYYQ